MAYDDIQPPHPLAQTLPRDKAAARPTTTSRRRSSASWRSTRDCPVEAIATEVAAILRLRRSLQGMAGDVDSDLISALEAAEQFASPEEMAKALWDRQRALEVFAGHRHARSRRGRCSSSISRRAEANILRA